MMQQQQNDARLYGDWARRDRHVLDHQKGSTLRAESSVRLDWDGDARQWRVSVAVTGGARRLGTSVFPRGTTTDDSLHECVAQLSRYCHVPPELILQLGTEAGIEPRPDDGKGLTRYEVRPKDAAVRTVERSGGIFGATATTDNILDALTISGGNQ